MIDVALHTLYRTLTDDFGNPVEKTPLNMSTRIERMIGERNMEAATAQDTHPEYTRYDVEAV